MIMNLTEMDDTDAKRLVDFAAGLVFATRGTIERVTSKVFLLSPPNVTVAAEDKQRIVDGGFFNQSLGHHGCPAATSRGCAAVRRRWSDPGIHVSRYCSIQWTYVNLEMMNGWEHAADA